MPLINRRSLLTAAVWGAGSLSALGRRTEAQPPPTQTPGRRRARSPIETERRRIIEAMAEADIPGAAVCLIREGKPVWVEGFGVTDRVSTQRVSEDTIFSIQSTSKNMTATAIMLAAQRGILDLDQPIRSYLPKFKVHTRFEAEPEERITLRLLLSHRAGFTHEAPVGNNYDPSFPSFEAHVRSISDTWLRFPVGERYRYSNLGFDLAGYILQQRTGVPFAEWLKTELFDPLGMNDTTAATDVYTSRTNRAAGHEHGYATVPLKTPLIPSGGVYTSARDMAAYCLFHLRRGKANGRALLAEELWNEMHGFALGGDYSLGVIRTELRYGTTPIRLLSHQGGGFGFGCVFYYCPEADLAWVAMFNRPASAAYRFGKQLIDEALTGRCGPQKPRMPYDDLAPILMLRSRLEQYVGTYIGRNFRAALQLNNEALDMRVGATSSSMQFTSPSTAYIVSTDGDVVAYKYSADSELEPPHFECSIGESSLDYNDGPTDRPGPDKSAWKEFLGEYRIEQWGRTSDTVTVHQKNGYLYLDETRLIIELEPGLFFTSDGEAVDFRDARAIWKNVPLRRVT